MEVVKNQFNNREWNHLSVRKGSSSFLGRNNLPLSNSQAGPSIRSIPCPPSSQVAEHSMKQDNIRKSIADARRGYLFSVNCCMIPSGY